jgi:hypothetical protein
VVEFIAMLENRLPALQHIVTGNRDATEKRFADVDDELGVVVVDMDQGGDVTGGPYTSMLSAVGTALE